jgi:O-antigen/teichoic acid export membrane protein
MSITSPKPSRVEINVASNLIGTALTVLIGLALVPIYVRLLGIESYGLVGFYATVLAALQVLDLGLSPTINRELARLSAIPGYAERARDLVRSLEVPYWLLGLLIGAVIAFLASLISSRWLQASALPEETVRSAVVLMAGLFVLQWPVSLYQGGLLGLQRQPLLNVVGVGFALVRGLGAVLVLSCVWSSILAFFAWQLIATAAQVMTLAVVLWRSLPASPVRPRLRWGELKRIWRFAAGLSLIGTTGIILTQADKLVMSRLLDLDMFGYYALASVAGGSLAYVVGPVFNAVFPRFSSLVARGEGEALKALYHRATQFLAVILLPAASVLVIMPLDIMRVWTGNANAAASTHMIVALLAAGSALNGLMALPYALQLAHGWTSLGVWLNLALVAVMVPLIAWMGLHFGGPGAAAVWIMTNALYMVVGLPLTHRRLMPGEAWRWLTVDIGVPLLASVAVVLVCMRTFEPAAGRVQEGVQIGVVLLFSACGAALAAPMVREWSVARLHHIGAFAKAQLDRRSRGHQ